MPFNPEVASGIVANMGQLWLTKRFKDLDIEVDDQRFCCHKFILCACSEFFKNLLHSEMENEELFRTIVIQNIDAVTFKLVLNAIYKGDVDLNVKNMLRFWHGVHELEITVLMPVCETFICNNLRRDNFLGILNESLLLKSSAVTLKCFCYLAEEFEFFRIKQAQVLLNFSSTALDRLVSNLSRDCQPLDQIVNFILKWVDFGQTKSTVCLNDKDGDNPKSSENTADSVTTNEFSSLVSNQLSPTSKQDNGSAYETTAEKKDIIEIIFQKFPTADSQQYIKSLLCSQSEDIIIRKLWLGKLLKKIKLESCSKQCLVMLNDNDLVMGNKECRDLVRQALETNTTNSAVKVDSPVPEPKDTMEDIVVYRMTSDPRAVYAMSLASSKIFKLLHCRHVTKIHTYENQLTYLEEIQGEKKLTRHDYNSINSSNPAIEQSFIGSNVTIFGDFMYVTRSETLYRTNLKLKTEQWTELFTTHEDLSIYSMVMETNNILLYRTKPNASGLFTVYRFNTETRHGMRILHSKLEGSKMLCFRSTWSLYLLTDLGYCFNATAFENTNKCGKDWLMDAKNIKQIWKGSNKSLSGVILHNDALILFVNVNKPTDEVNTIVPIYPNSRYCWRYIELRHLYNAIDCFPLTVPSRFLTEEM